MATELRKIRYNEISEQDIDYRTFNCVLQASERISKIFSSTPTTLSFAFLSEHTDDIIADCFYFQKQELSKMEIEQIFAVIGRKLPLAIIDPHLESIYLRSLFRTIRNTDIRTISEALISTNVGVSRLSRAGYNNHSPEISIEKLQQSRQGNDISSDRFTFFSEEDRGYEEILETTDPYARITHALASMPEDNRKIIQAMLRQDTAFADFKTAHPQAVDEALQMFHSLVYQLPANTNFLPAVTDEEEQQEDKTSSSSTKVTTSIESSRMRLQQILQENGGLRHFFRYATSTSIDSYEQALPIMILFHYLGYYHPEETRDELRLSEQISPKHFKNLLSESIDGLSSFKNSQTTHSFHKQLLLLNNYSAAATHGERVKLPHNLADAIDLMYTIVARNPSRLKRLASPVQKSLVEILLRTLDGHHLSVEHIYEQLLEEHAFVQQDGTRRATTRSEKDIFNYEVFDTLVRLLDNTPHYETGERIPYYSYVRRILQHGPLSSEETALLQLYDELNTLYNQISRPHSTSTAIREDSIQELNPHSPNKLIQIAAILGCASVENIFDRKRKLALQIIGLRLGIISQEDLLSPDSVKRIVRFIKETAQHESLESMAQKSGCSVELLQRIIKINFSKNLLGKNEHEEALQWLLNQGYSFDSHSKKCISRRTLADALNQLFPESFPDEAVRLKSAANYLVYAVKKGQIPPSRRIMNKEATVAKLMEERKTEGSIIDPEEILAQLNLSDTKMIIKVKKLVLGPQIAMLQQTQSQANLPLYTAEQLAQIFGKKYLRIIKKLLREMTIAETNS